MRQWALVCALVGTAVGCSSGSGGEDNNGATISGGGSGSSGSGRGGGESVNGSGSTGAQGSGGDGTFFGFDAGLAKPPEPTDASCIATSQGVEQIVVETEVEVPYTVEVKQPIAIYLMQDRSSSMVGRCGNGDPCNPEGWNEVTTAITNFVQSSNSDGIDVGLGYFPPLSGNIQCNGSTCTEPSVAVAALPGNADAIVTSLNNAKPTFDPPLYTPTECALRGMTAFCKDYMDRTGEKCVGVLVSDGAPTRCNEETVDLAEIAADAFVNDGVLTFTLGMTGADFGMLDRVAEAGGSDCMPDSDGFACNATAGADAFLDALNAIRETVSVTETRTETRKEVISTTLDCEWKIPAPPRGQVFDPEKVNVRLTLGDGTAARIGKVASESACEEFNEGWHFDDASNPTKVLVCPNTCDVLKNSDDGRVDLEFGCATIHSEPH